MEQQLWQIEGPFWKLPVLITSNGSMVRVDPAPIPMLSRQAQALASLLFRVGNEVEGVFWVPVETMPQIGIQVANDTDPESLVIWSPGLSNDVPQTNAGFEAFGRAYAEWGGMVKAEAAAVLWASFCRFALHTLVNLNRSVPMGWCDLAPLLARENWKDQLLSMDKPVLVALGHKRFRDHSAQLPKLKLRGVPEHLKRDEMVSMIDEKYVGWCVNVLYHRPWYDQIRATEEYRYRRLGRSQYWWWVVRQMRAQSENALVLYSHFLEKAILPAPKLPKESGRGVGVHCIKQGAGTTSGTGVGKATKRRYRVSGDYDRYDFLRSSKLDVAGADASLPSEMPDLQSKEPDMRDAGRDVG